MNAVSVKRAKVTDSDDSNPVRDMTCSDAFEHELPAPDIAALTLDEQTQLLRHVTAPWIGADKRHICEAMPTWLVRAMMLDYVRAPRTDYSSLRILLNICTTTRPDAVMVQHTTRLPVVRFQTPDYSLSLSLPLSFFPLCRRFREKYVYLVCVVRNLMTRKRSTLFS
jgi:hypothetical protein